MSKDCIGDFLTVIRNGIKVAKRTVQVQFSNEKLGIARVLKEEGYIKDFQKIEDEPLKPILKVHLKYVNGESSIQEINRVSTPGRRSYERINNLEPVVGGLGISILSTNKGIITDKQAKELHVGGEVICHVW